MELLKMGNYMNDSFILFYDTFLLKKIEFVVQITNTYISTYCIDFMNREHIFICVLLYGIND